MASKVDMSLDDIVMLKKNKGSGKQLQQKPYLGNRQSAGGNVQNGGSTSTKGADLRKLIAKKQKSNISDLRTKLKPKALYTSKYASKQGSLSQPNTPQSAGFESRNFNKTLPRFKEETTPMSKPRSRRSDPGPLSSRKPRGSPKLPTYEDAKKITVTVPGTTRSTSASEYTSGRREERLAAAIARSREQRQENYMKGREEFLASSITSALRDGGSGGGGMDRERGGVGGTFSRMQLRGFSRSPSPPPVVGYQDPLPIALPRSTLPAPRNTFSARPREGITTVTSMIIQNLSDTVSKNDVAELCRAVGPLEAVQMMAPGVTEVVFKYKDDALEAYKKYNQRNLDGQPMICQLQPTSRARLNAGGYGHRTLSDAYTDDLYSQSSSGFY